MCGIAGIVGSDLSQDHLARSAACLAHRGPDDEGICMMAGAALATRRLSIIDVQGGHQPMSNEDGSVWITYNGEIVNAPELRAELQAAGHIFQSRTDTETLVHAYEEWGEHCLNRLRGMFAFGIWDQRQGRLLLARDRFGIKPLYYAQDSGKFAFASEIGSLFAALPEFSRQADSAALRALLGYGFIPSPMCAFKGVMKVPAGHMLTLQGTRLTLQPYWRLNLPGTIEHPRLDLVSRAHEFVGLLTEAVETWRLSDVPVGALLSGGIDSAALAALLARGSSVIDTFTIGFESNSHDESGWARKTARIIGSHHNELTFTAKDFDQLPGIIQYLEEPQCSATSLPIYLLYQACHAAGYKVIMTGEGADELLGGYHWFASDRRIQPLLRLPVWARRAAAHIPLRTSAAAQRVIIAGDRDDTKRYWRWLEVADESQRNRLLMAERSDTETDPPNGTWADEWRPTLGHSTEGMRLLESRIRLVDFINFEVDRMSMANSVEARPPFLDHKLWEYCAPLPLEFKFGPTGNKLLLREGMKGILPESILNQPKRGLAAPHAKWLRNPLPKWAAEAVHPTALQDSGYFEPAEVERLFASHRNGRADLSRLLMGILTTQLWHDKFIAN
jgi:asparagine synthase (glutamine-hydrolysing)